MDELSLIKRWYETAKAMIGNSETRNHDKKSQKRHIKSTKKYAKKLVEQLPRFSIADIYDIDEAGNMDYSLAIRLSEDLHRSLGMALPITPAL